MIRRRQFDAVDGYPNSSGADAGGGSNGPSDPTARTATTPAPSDPIAMAIDRILKGILEADELIERLDGGRLLVQHSEDSERGRQSTVSDCRCCSRVVTNQGSDRLRAGYCDACYRAWLDYSRNDRDPSHILFQAQRINYLADKEAKATVT